MVKIYHHLIGTITLLIKKHWKPKNKDWHSVAEDFHIPKGNMLFFQSIMRWNFPALSTSYRLFLVVVILLGSLRYFHSHFGIDWTNFFKKLLSTCICTLAKMPSGFPSPWGETFIQRQLPHVNSVGTKPSIDLYYYKLGNEK